ncbi:unnamed protein product [Musa banksii]
MSVSADSFPPFSLLVLMTLWIEDKGRPLPKFGEWDVNDPASAEGFTVIFNKARDERKTGGNSRETDSPGKGGTAFKHGPYASKPNAKKWFCCMYAAPEA